MHKGWMRVREAAAMLSVSETTIRRRIAEGQLRGRTGRSGRQEVFLCAKLRQQAQAGQATASETTSQPAPETLATTPHSAASASTEQATGNNSVATECDADLLRRYERMAGGSLILAQQRADELTQAASAAYENLAHARHQLRQARKVALAGWGTAAGAVLLLLVLSLVVGLGGTRTDTQTHTARPQLQQVGEHFDLSPTQAHPLDTATANTDAQALATTD